MREEKLRRDDDVIEDSEVAAEAVAAAQLCQRQVHLVHAGRRGRKTQTEREGRRGG